MPAPIEERYLLFDTELECAESAVKTFAERGWNPITMSEALGLLYDLRSEAACFTAGTSESGRLCVHNGRFGHHNPAWIDKFTGPKGK